MPRSFLVKKQDGEAAGQDSTEVSELVEEGDDLGEVEVDEDQKDKGEMNVSNQDKQEESKNVWDDGTCSKQHLDKPVQTQVIKIVISKGANKTTNLPNDTTKSVKKSYPCEVCGKVFSAQYTLSRHLPVHTGVRKFQCDICGKAFRQASTLCRHKVIHSDNRTHKCKLCPKSFNRSSTLIAHMKTHNPVKVFVCDVCGKAFHQKGNLKNHKYTHTGERPYQCPCCERCFNQHSNLSFHLQQAHAEEKLLSCHICQQKFQKKYELRKHEADVHNIVYPKQDPPRYMLKKQFQITEEEMQNTPTNSEHRTEMSSERDFLNTDVLEEERNNNDENLDESCGIHPEIVNLQKTSLIMFKFNKDNQLQVVTQPPQQDGGEVSSGVNEN